MSDDLSEYEFFTVPELATALRVSNMTVLRLIENGELAAVRVGRQYRIHKKSAIAYMNRPGKNNEPRA